MKSLQFLLSTAFLMSAATWSFAQKGMSVSRMDMSYKELQASFPNDPLADSVQVRFTMYVTDFGDADTLLFNYGKTEGAGDIITQKIVKVTKDGKQYINYKGRLFEVAGGKVEFFDAIGKNQRGSNAYLSISGRDKNGKKAGEFKKRMQ